MPHSSCNTPVTANQVQRQFARRCDKPSFIYAEINRRMLERLALIKLNPHLIVDAGCGMGNADLNKLYPKARYLGVDFCLQQIQNNQARQKNQQSSWIKNLIHKKPTIQYQCTNFDAIDLPPNSVDLLWSNMALHWHDQPHAVFGHWRRLLKPNGLLMFSCFGPSTFKELRHALQVAQIKTSTPSFIDMHNLGDMLLGEGFQDPVMDQEIITLSYKTPKKMLEDIYAIGGNPCPERIPHLGRQWYKQLCAALTAGANPSNQTITLTLEINYGHSWKGSTQRIGNETHISFEQLRREINSKK